MRKIPPEILDRDAVTALEQRLDNGDGVSPEEIHRLIETIRHQRDCVEGLRAALGAAYSESPRDALAVRVRFVERENDVGPNVLMVASCASEFNDVVVDAVGGVLERVLNGKIFKREDS